MLQKAFADSPKYSSPHLGSCRPGPCRCLSPCGLGPCRPPLAFLERALVVTLEPLWARPLWAPLCPQGLGSCGRRSGRACRGQPPMFDCGGPCLCSMFPASPNPAYLMVGTHVPHFAASRRAKSISALGPRQKSYVRTCVIFL